tara:strand:+ start:2848 stop:3435 length:588 start_codon:yes stop_codon:yes gene_type:complete
MKLTKKQFEKIKKFVKRKIAKNDVWHKLFHIKQTIKLAKALAKKEKADINKCIVIAWLHDIAKNHQNKKTDHGDKGAELAKPFLEKLKFSEKDIKDICYAIQQHNKGRKKKIKEAAVIWDADKLQTIGAGGVLRCYGCSVNNGNNQEKAYKENIWMQKFFIKKFKTKTGAKIAKQNYKFTKEFDKKYKKDLKAKL